jgi:PAS domain S-box-containing protein
MQGLSPSELGALYEALFVASADGVFLTKPDGTIVRANPAACAALRMTEDEIVRLGRDGVVVDDTQLRAALHTRHEAGVVSGVLHLRRSGGDVFPAEVTSGIIQGPIQFAYTIFRDITQRLRVEEERRLALERNEALVAELTEALATVKTLTGLLPICMYCKKIRGDSGYWNRIEAYLASHTGATFSHGVCPDCAAEHFPGL